MKRLIPAIALCLLLVACGEGYSDGERTGQVFKFSHKGIFNKSWEGSLYLGGVHSESTGNNGSALVMDKFSFSILDSDSNKAKDAIETLKRCAAERATCTIHYEQDWLPNPFYQDTGYNVTSVEIQK